MKVGKVWVCLSRWEAVSVWLSPWGGIDPKSQRNGAVGGFLSGVFCSCTLNTLGKALCYRPGGVHCLTLSLTLSPAKALLCFLGARVRSQLFSAIGKPESQWNLSCSRLGLRYHSFRCVFDSPILRWSTACNLKLNEKPKENPQPQQTPTKKNHTKTSWRIGFLINWVTYCETLVQTHVLYIVFNHNAVKWPLVVSSSYCVVSKWMFDREESFMPALKSLSKERACTCGGKSKWKSQANCCRVSRFYTGKMIAPEREFNPEESQ